jgi:gliding motility-associated-like protein
MKRIIVQDGKVINTLTIPSNANRFDKNDDHSANQKNTIIASPITLNITVIPSSCSYSNGAVIIAASGGTTPYLYTLVSGWSQNTGYFPNLGPIPYTFTVSDAAGQSTTTTVTVTNNLAGPSVNFVSSTPASTCSSADASVTVQGNGGHPPYEYSLDLINFQTSNVFTGLSNGAYGFFVRDANGCINALPGFAYTWSLSCGLALGLGYSSATCGNDGRIDIHVIEQMNSPYTYSLDGGPFMAIGDWQNLAPGLHQIRIRDVNGLIYLVLVSIPLHCGIGIDFITVDAACQQNDGSLSVTASGGATPYTYTIDGINYQSSNTFSGLASGNYAVTVKDASGFTQSSLATVHDRCPAVTLATTGETCLLNDGTITATATNGTSPYQYSIDGVNFQSSNIFNGLVAGTYTITLKDALGFTTAETVTINYNCLAVTAIHTNVVCGNMNGTITATGSGGSPPYLYSINGINYQTSNIFNGLGAGAYIISVKDATGETAITSVSISDSPGPYVTVTSTPTGCTNNDGTLTITPIGGTPPYTYTLDNINYQASNVFTNLWVNNYFASAKDANGCQWGITQWVEWDCPTITTNVTNEICGSAGGTISITITNATAPFQYSLDGINFQTSAVFTGLAAGSYTITVRSALNHTNTATVTVNNTCPVVSATVSDGTCGNSNGSIVATGSNGMPPYQYSKDGINFQTSNIFNGLAAGLYTITIKDAGNITNTTTVSIGNIPGPTISVLSGATNCMNNNAVISVTATGGTSPYIYSIDGINFQANNVFNNNPSGNYTATIKDANGCIASGSFVVPLISNITITAGSNITICEGSGTTFSVASNGTGFTWSPAASLNNASQLNPYASPLVTTKYYLIATLGVCSKTDSLIVSVNPAPVAYAGKDSTICYGQSIQLNGSGGLNYDWTPSTYLSDSHVNEPVVMSPASTVTYSLKVTDSLGCTSLLNSSIIVSVTPPPKVFAGNDTAIVMNEPFQLNAIDINGSGFIQYIWSPSVGLNNAGLQNPFASLDRNMTYVLTAITQSGCQGTDEININVYKGPEIYVPNAFTPNNDGRNDILKAIPVGIKEFKYFIIYNRWGQRIFYTRDSSYGWDGKNKNLLLDAGAYVWIAEVISRKGTVTLIK